MQGNPQKLQAAELMLSGMTDKAIAKKLNVDPSTVWRWRNSTPVAAVIAAERNRRHETIRDEMLRLADDALDVLAAILRDEKASNGIRLKAASVILDRVGINPPASSAAVSRDQSREHSATWSLEDEELPGMGMFG